MNYHRMTTLDRFREYGLQRFFCSFEFIAATVISVAAVVTLPLVNPSLPFENMSLAYLAVGISLVGIMISGIAVIAAIDDKTFLAAMGRVSGYENFLLLTLRITSIAVVLTTFGAFLSILLVNVRCHIAVEIIFSITTGLLAFSLLSILSIIEHLLKIISIRNEISQKGNQVN